MTAEPASTPYAPAEPKGALPYGLGFLAYLPIPFFNLIITGIVMAAVYPSQRKKSALAAENARYAANWGLTLIALFVVIVTLIIGGAVITEQQGGDSGFVALPVIAVILLFATGIAHLVVIIMGLVRANKGQVLHNRLAIPFLR